MQRSQSKNQTVTILATLVLLLAALAIILFDRSDTGDSGAGMKGRNIDSSSVVKGQQKGVGDIGRKNKANDNIGNDVFQSREGAEIENRTEADSNAAAQEQLSSNGNTAQKEASDRKPPNKKAEELLKEFNERMQPGFAPSM